ncbi:SDR family NAD(P)-dependent oxidoreductase [Streptomyces zaomyceticus]|uniref:SDR family NAD(P)-dependent oxidoreductase n=1 Tax=Streptomyces zaomyceticus TaxID=68286 RepID=UPI0032463914
MNRFTGKTVLITGGTSGMGLATAHRLVSEGAHVVVTGRTRARVDAAVEDLGPNASGSVADVAALDALDALMESVREQHGRIDSLFANAGTGAFVPFQDITEADFDQAVDVNLKGVFFTVQKALPLLVDGGSVVINASWTLHRGNSVLTLYSATKAAAHNLARTLAAGLGPRNIRVNSISPGYIDTPMYPAASLSTEEAAAVTDRIVAGRFGRAEEVAAAVAFLASSDASYVNGQDLVVDGGLLAAVPA